MSLLVAPSRQYEATLEVGTTGLVGTIQLGTYDGDTATQALSTANINEIGSSGVYVATRTSPSTVGQYVLVWSLDGTLDPEQVSTEDLVVTSDTPARSSLTVESLATYEASLEVGISGLVGTIEMGVYEGDTAVDALSASNINEIGTTGIYVATRTAPEDTGQYVIIWSLDGTLDPEQVSTEDLRVVSADSGPGSGNLYVTVTELKDTVEITGDASDDEIEEACNAASRAIDEYKKTTFYPVEQTRYYTGVPGEQTLTIRPLNDLTSITVDEDGDGIYEATWVSGTDFWLEPANAAPDGHPYTRVRLISPARFPRHLHSVRVEGSHGYAETPWQVKRAARLLAARLFRRRETPYAMVVLTGELMAAARIGRMDPDVAFLLDPLPPVRQPLMAVRLG